MKYLFHFLFIIALNLNSNVQATRYLNCYDTSICRDLKLIQDINENPLKLISAVPEFVEGAMLFKLEKEDKFYEIELNLYKSIINLKIKNSEISSNDHFSFYNKRLKTDLNKSDLKIEKEYFSLKIDEIRSLKIYFYPFKIEYFVLDENIISIIGNILKISNDESKISFILNKSNFQYGIPERAGNEVIDDKSIIRIYNIDKFKYKYDKNTVLYGTIPVIFGKHKYNAYYENSQDYFIDDTIINNEIKENFNKNVYTSFLLFESPAQSFIKTIKNHYEQNSTTYGFTTENNYIEFSIFGDITNTKKELQKLYSIYQNFIGLPKLPPLWSLGNHHSRWNFYDIEDVIETVNLFEKYDVDMDSIWLDIDHTDEKRYMTYDKKFAKIEKLTNFLDERGIKLVVIIDPHIKIDDDYHLYNYSYKNDLLIYSNRKKNIFEGNCWSGNSVYFNFFDSNVRSMWINYIKNNKEYIVNDNVSIWNDMNEPSVFDTIDLSFPEYTHAKLSDSVILQQKQQKFELIKKTKYFKNYYGMLMANSSFKALYERYKQNNSNGKRPFVLTRSFYTGSQIFTAHWNGDMISEFNSIKLSNQMMAQLSLSGFSFVGTDIGGFANNIDPSYFMFWYQTNIFNPFLRSHSHNETFRREFWLYDEDIKFSIIESLKLRQKLKLFIYSSFFKHSQKGYPLIETLWNFLNDFELEKKLGNYFVYYNTFLIRTFENRYEQENEK